MKNTFKASFICGNCKNIFYRTFPYGTEIVRWRIMYSTEYSKPHEDWKKLICPHCGSKKVQ